MVKEVVQTKPYTLTSVATLIQGKGKSALHSRSPKANNHLSILKLQQKQPQKLVKAPNVFPIKPALQGVASFW
jgi:hypothetical protein